MTKLRELNNIKQSMLKISSLSELYSELINSKPSKEELQQKQFELDYIKDQILKLSMHSKHLLKKVQNE